MYVLQISMHDPDKCPMFNEKSKEAMVSLIQQQDAVLEKHSIKLMCSWTEAPTHEIYNIYEAPSMEAFTELYKEPVILGWMAFNVIQTKIVQSQRDIKAMLNL